MIIYYNTNRRNKGGKCMYRLGELILTAGVLIFMLGGLGVILNIIPRNSTIIPPLGILALIFIGAGASIKKKHNE